MDLRYAFRQLAKTPGFAAVAIVTLALGIGANTAIFSFISSWMLKPAPFAAMDRIVLLFESNKRTGVRSPVAPADFADWRAKAGIFEELAAAAFASYNLTGTDEPVKVPGYEVTANFFRSLGVTPALGREFTEAEQTASSHVAILTHELWRDRFSSDPNVLGRTITLDGFPTTIVGVMREDFQFIPMGPAEILTPVDLSPEAMQARNRLYLRPVGRLKPGISVTKAAAAMTALQASLETAYPTTNANRGAIVITITEEINRQSGNDAIRVVYAIVCCILLMACANVANLIMSRSSARRKEMAVRLAIGANRWRLMRQLLTETLILFTAGAAGGILLARWGVSFLLRAIPARSLPYLPNHGRVDVDSTTLLFALGVALITGVMFGLAPALEGTQFDLNTILKDAGSRGSSSASGGKFRKILVGAEMAMAVMVVVCGALLVNSFARIIRADVGFNGDRVLVAEMQLPPSYKTPASINQFANAVLERASALPGVDRASIAEYTPMSDGGRVLQIAFEGRPEPLPAQIPSARVNTVSPGFLESLNIALVAGRTISREDSPEATRVVVINETMANRYYADENPIGKRVQIQRAWCTVIGIVKEVKYYTPNSPPENQAYLAFAQTPRATVTLVVRTSSDPAPVAKQVRGVVREVDPNQPVARIETIANRMQERSAPDRILTEMTGFFGILALFLASIGLYGVMTYSVSQRTQEIGVRMALGARGGDVLTLVIRQGMVVVLSGMIIGIVGAFFLSKLLAFFLYGVNPHDAATFGSVFVLLLAVALFSCWIPARRAARVDPLVALRHE